MERMWREGATMCQLSKVGCWEAEVNKAWQGCSHGDCHGYPRPQPRDDCRGGRVNLGERAEPWEITEGGGNWTQQCCKLYKQLMVLPTWGASQAFMIWELLRREECTSFHPIIHPNVGVDEELYLRSFKVKQRLQATIIYHFLWEATSSTWSD